jgi:hypothetical protein
MLHPIEPTAGMFPSFTAGSELALRRSFLPPNLLLLHPPPLTFLPCAPAAIPTSKRRRLHSYANHISGAAAMRGSRMRPVVKVEDGVGGVAADEGLQPEADAGQLWQRRRLSDSEGAVSDEALSRRAYLEAEALAVEGMERTRVLGEELLQAKALIVQLEAEVRIKDGIIQSKDVIIQSKDDQLNAEIRFKKELQAELERRDALAVVGGGTQSAATAEAAARTPAAAAAAAAAVFELAPPAIDALFPFSDKNLPGLVISNNRLSVVDPPLEGRWGPYRCAWVISERGVAAGCGVVRWAVKLGFSDKFHRGNAIGRNFCLGVASKNFTEFTESSPKQSWFFRNDYMVANGRKDGDVFTPRPFATQDTVTVELERAPGVVGVLRVRVAGKTPREWRGLPSDGMLWPIVCLVHPSQSYTMVALP